MIDDIDRYVCWRNQRAAGDERVNRRIGSIGANRRCANINLTRLSSKSADVDGGRRFLDWYDNTISFGICLERAQSLTQEIILKPVDVCRVKINERLVSSFAIGRELILRVRELRKLIGGYDLITNRIADFAVVGIGDLIVD